MASFTPPQKEPVWEATKEIGRVFLFAGVSAVISYVLNKLTALPQTEMVILGTVLLRWLDKFLHEKAKVDGTVTLTRIAPF